MTRRDAIKLAIAGAISPLLSLLPEREKLPKWEYGFKYEAAKPEGYPLRFWAAVPISEGQMVYQSDMDQHYVVTSDMMTVFDWPVGCALHAAKVDEIVLCKRVAPRPNWRSGEGTDCGSLPRDINHPVYDRVLGRVR